MTTLWCIIVGGYTIPSHKYPILNDEGWLKKQYLAKKKSCVQLAKVVGATNANSVRQALLRIGVEPRDRSIAQTANREEEWSLPGSGLDAMLGSLLGGGSLLLYNKSSSCCRPRFSKRNKNFDHVRHVAQEMLLSPKAIKGRNESYDSRPAYTIFTLRSPVSSSLDSYYKEWYPASNGYKKVVPRSLKLSRQILLHWFMDDGCSLLRKRSDAGYKTGRWVQKTKQVFIMLCTECFSKSGVDFLCLRLRSDLNINSSPTPYRWKTGSGWRIRVPQSQADKFFEVIGECPVPSLEYKWK